MANEIKMTVLVTGGAGFVAGWCIVELIAKGYRVRTTVRDISKETAIRSAVGVQDDRLQFFIADLTQDAGWEAAVKDCDFVLHVASQLFGGAEANLNTFLIPARDGALRVLRAAVKAKVKRIVMTSAAATTRPRLDSNQTSNETIWADPDDPQFNDYQKSKILAERAAWKFMRTEGGSTEFTTVLPGAVFGPLLSKDNLRSAQIVKGLLVGNPPAIPKVGFWVVDVRDLADAHIRAMIAPKAAGERFIAAGEFMWMADIASILKTKLGSRAKKVSSLRMPNFVVWLLAPYNAQLKFILPLLGKRFEQSSEKARQVLGFSTRPMETTIIETAESVLKLSQGETS
jgi:dihydroflavonol-4-reductase